MTDLPRIVTLLLGTLGVLLGIGLLIWHGVTLIAEGYGSGEPANLGFGLLCILTGLFMLFYLVVLAGWVWPPKSTL